MISEPQTLERYRGRWRRARQSLWLLDPLEEGFGTGELPEFVGAPRVRMLILPSDPEAYTIDFDDRFWRWWLEERADPSTGQRASWGGQSRSTVSAAVRFEQPSQELDRYVALYHHGGLELGLGRDAGWRATDGALFKLVTIVGRIWAAFALYGAVLEYCAMQGPWEVTLALRDTEGAILTEFGARWPDVGNSSFYTSHATKARGLLMRREIHEWPDADTRRDVAFSLGGQIENAWGSKERRFLAREGESKGKFDTGQYRWE